MLEKIFIFHIVDLDHQMLERFEQGFLRVQAQHRDDMRDVGPAQGGLVPEREEARQKWGGLISTRRHSGTGMPGGSEEGQAMTNLPM